MSERYVGPHGERAIPTDSRGTPSFDSPTTAIEYLRPDLAAQYEVAATAIRLLAEAIGLKGKDDHLSLLPDDDWPPTHQLAATECVGFVMRVHDCSRAEAIRRVAAANPYWFRQDKFDRYTNRMRQESRMRANGRRGERKI